MHGHEIQTPQDTPLRVVAPHASDEATALQRRLHMLFGDLDLGDDSVAQWLVATSTTSFRHSQSVSLRPSSTTPPRGRSTSKPASEARRSMRPASRAVVMPKPDTQPAARRPKSPRWQPTTPNSVPGQNGATTGRPDSNSQHRTPLRTPTQSSAATRSAFAGKTGLPIKRPSDDGHGGRASKAPRLSFVDEVILSIEEAKNELLQAGKVLKEDLSAGPGVRLSSEAQSSLQGVESALSRLADAQDAGVSKNDLEDVANRLRSQEDVLSSHVRKDVRLLLKSDLASIKTDTTSAIKDLISGKMQEMMDALNESREKPAPRPGPGFIPDAQLPSTSRVEPVCVCRSAGTSRLVVYLGVLAPWGPSPG